MRWKRGAKMLAIGLVALPVFALYFALLTFLTMWLWNKLAVVIFGLPVLSFFQTLGLMVLGRLLTGGFGPRGWRGSPGSRMRGYYMRKRWQHLSPEMRERFAQRWGGPFDAPEKPATDPGTSPA